MLTARNAAEKEKDTLFNNIRHLIAKEHSCPKHLTMVDLKVIMAILTIRQYDDAE